ncbi:MAG: S8 family serine peptidase [Planctomycetota bacterium JB042]
MFATPSLPLVAAVLLLSPPPGEPDPLRPKPERAVVDPMRSTSIVEVKFVEGSEVRLRAGRFVGATPDVEKVNLLLDGLSASARRTFMQSEEWLAKWRRDGERRSGKRLHDLNLFFCLDVPEGEAAPVCDVLNLLPAVEIATPAAVPSDPSVPVAALACLPALAAPDFSALQTYRDPAPIGVDATFAHTFSNGRGGGLTILDCETGWTDDHEDLIGKAKDQFVGYVPAPYPWSHGTAVLGELVAEENGFGMTGLCVDADVKMSTHSPTNGPTNIPGSIMNAAAAAQTGDVVVVEIQCYGGPSGPYPCEYDPTTFATVQAATANGVHVIAAAGNGDNDLDHPSYGGAFNLAVRDSGAIIVGASNGASLDKASFSNHGSRLTSSGWGYNVATTGYGSLYSGGSAQTSYADDFSGTSSATPIVTGAAACLLSAYREAFGVELDPLTLRTVLAQTGTPQGSGGTIGSRPNLRAAFRAAGIPEIELSGSSLPGTTLTITCHASAGDGWGLFWSPVLADPPIHAPPGGYLALDPSFLWTLFLNGGVGAGGTGAVSFTIPNLPSLSGFESWFQGVVFFSIGPGFASFTNTARLEIQ